MIYAHTLGGHTWRIKHPIANVYMETCTPHSRRSRTSVDNPIKSVHSLLRVCTQIHAETRLLPYTLSTFRVECPQGANNWARGTPRYQREVIKPLELNVLKSWGGVNTAKNINMRPVQEWWIPDQIIQLELPALKTLHLVVYFEGLSWLDESLDEDRAKNRAKMAHVVRKLEDMAEGAHQGLRMTVQLECASKCRYRGPSMGSRRA
jgi:hypothetical protein